MRNNAGWHGLLPMLALLSNLAGAGQAKVAMMRVPDGGIQPVTAVDDAGGVHLIYYKGEPGGGDIFYARSTDGSATFSQAMQVNRGAASAVAAGNIRGAHLALGKNGRAHVAWMGSGKAPKGPDNATPMLYARMNDAGTAFEPERNVMQFAYGLDGGGSIAADGAGNVHVVWHADAPGVKGEANRLVWIARSGDEGKTFKRETPAFKQPTGACACCGMRAFATRQGEVAILFRSASGAAKTPDARNMFLLTSKDKGAAFSGLDLHPWNVNMCVMSTAALAESSGSMLAAWETKGQIYFSKLNPASMQPSPPVAAPGSGGKRKHPAVAANPAGETILAWTDGMGWQKGGSVEWQVYDKAGIPTVDKGKANGVPPNSLVSAFARADGGFTVVY